MQHPVFTPSMATAILRNTPVPLTPRELVTDKMLREYAAIDPLHIADGDDKVMLAGLSMALADICGELLARRAAMAKGRA